MPRRGLRQGKGELELDWGEPAEAALSASTVVGVLDPLDDLVAELGTGPPAAATVEDVLLEQGVEGLYGGVVAGGADSTHRPGESRGLEDRPEGSGSKPPLSG